MAIELNPSATVQQAQQRISSGQAINQAKDDAAGSAITTRLNSVVDGTTQAIKNTGDGLSLLQTAEGTLTNVVDNLQRLRELDVQSGNGIYSQADRDLLAAERTQIVTDISTTLQEASFNDQPLFQTQQTLDFQIGPNAGDTQSVTLSNLSGITENLTSLNAIDSTIDALTDNLAGLGAQQNQLLATADELAQSRLDQLASRSRIADADMAQEVSALAQADIQGQVETAMQVQANEDQEQVLNLLGGL